MRQHYERLFEQSYCYIRCVVRSYAACLQRRSSNSSKCKIWTIKLLQLHYPASVGCVRCSRYRLYDLEDARMLTSKSIKKRHAHTDCTGII